MTVVFAFTRQAHDSYRDLQSLALAANFPTCFIDEIDPNANVTYIVGPMTDELKVQDLARGHRRCKIVWWCLERNLSDIIDEALRLVDAVWVSDRYHQSLDPRTTFVVLGSHQALLNSFSPRDKKWDVAHLSHVNGRRDRLYNQLKQAGLSVAPTAWGAERSSILLNSKFLLNVHQTDALIGEPLRFAVAAAHAVPLISETCLDSYPLVPGVDFLAAHYGDLAGLCIRAARGQLDILTQLGANLYERLCVQYPFAREVRRAAAAVQSRTYSFG
jgi:hypothetical protein